MKIENIFSLEKKLISGLKLINHHVYRDERGFFFESYNKHLLDKLLDKEINFCQLNQSYSKKGVLRGLHYQLEPSDQGKLIQCVSGSIFDVAVDIRKNSPTFKSWFGIELNEQIKQSFWIPPGFAHGFLTLSEFAVVQYLVTNNWDRKLERSIVWNDPDIGIIWPINNFIPIISMKDSKGLYLKEAESSNNIF
tara:strand:- start:1135 stop:1713 length:579 start_codon:yes stop_codon:yes gene_type:complete